LIPVSGLILPCTIGAREIVFFTSDHSQKVIVMKTIEILVALAILLPIVLFYLKKKLSSRRTPPDYLKKISQENELDITDFEDLPGKFLVMDNLHKKLLFSRYASSKVQSLVIDLSRILSCRMEKEVIITSGHAHIERIGLVFKHKFHKGEEDIHIPLYDSHKDGMDEAFHYYEIAKGWVKRVEQGLDRQVQVN
jgi:hypothetical protein